MKRGFKYDELKRVVIVAIIDFELEEAKRYKRGRNSMEYDGKVKTKKGIDRHSRNTYTGIKEGKRDVRKR